jgi:hypothetical protein
MFSKTNVTTAVACILLLGMAALFSQEPQTTKETGTPPCGVFKGKLFELKHRDAGEITAILTALGSGYKGSLINGYKGSNILTVRDCPENIAAIEEAIKVLDISPASRGARAPSPDIELLMHVLIASNSESAGNQYPQELKDVVKQLQVTLTYKSYSLLTSIVQRIRLDQDSFQRIPSGQDMVGGNGTTVMGPPIFEKPLEALYSYQIDGLSIEPGGKDVSTLIMKRFTFKIDSMGARKETPDYKHAEIQTSLRIREEEKVVVGTASLHDKGLVLVLSARILK